MTIKGQSHRKACKINFYWKIYGNFSGPLYKGQHFLRAPFCTWPPLQVFVNGRLDKQTYFRKKKPTERDLTQRLIIFYLLVSQLLPSNPAAHVQVYVLTPSVQSPPFWQGFGWQSSMSKKKMENFVLVESWWTSIKFLHLHKWYKISNN